MKRILSIIMVCILLTATLSVSNVMAVADNSSKTELINLLQYYCWDFGDSPEFGYEFYTKESYDVYYSAKQKAEKLIADESTTEEEFQNMINEFETAREALVSVKADTDNSSKTALINLLQYYCWDFGDSPEFGYEFYTKESYDVYYSAKQKAEKLIADENTTEEEFQNMINEFETARKNLISVASFIIGDVNLDGNIDVDDVTNIQKHLSGLLTFNDGTKKAADLNKDGIISIDDVTALQKMIAGI